MCPWAISGSDRYNKMDLSDLAEELKTDKAKHAELMETCLGAV